MSAEISKEWLSSGEVTSLFKQAGCELSLEAVKYKLSTKGAVRKALDNKHWEYLTTAVQQIMTEQAAVIPEEYISVYQAAKKHKVTINRIYYRIRTDDAFPAVYVRGQYYVSESAVRAIK